MPFRQIQFFDHAHPSVANETADNSAVSVKKIEMKLYLYRDFARGFTFSGRKILWTIMGFEKFNFLHHAHPSIVN